MRVLYARNLTSESDLTSESEQHMEFYEAKKLESHQALDVILMGSATLPKNKSNDVREQLKHILVNMTGSEKLICLHLRRLGLDSSEVCTFASR